MSSNHALGYLWKELLLFVNSNNIWWGLYMVNFIGMNLQLTKNIIFEKADLGFFLF